MNNRIDAIYARQSVDKKDSISIESQVSLHDITKKLTADGMRTYHGRPLSRRKNGLRNLTGFLSGFMRTALTAQSAMSGF